MVKDKVKDEDIEIVNDLDESEFKKEDENFKEHDFVESEIEISEDDVSDFFIGDTILSSASTMQARQGYNLEEIADRNKIEGSGWEGSENINEEEERGRDFYNNSSSNLYGENQNGDNLYQNRNDEDIYSENKNNDKNPYYIETARAKNYGEFVDNRRSGRSILEIAGFEDKEKQKVRDMRGFIKKETDNN